MSHQDDLRTIAKFTKSIATATGDPGALRPDYKTEVAAAELASNAKAETCEGYRLVEAACTSAKVQMVKACASMLAEVEGLDAATQKAVRRVNDSAGRATQSLAKTKDILGPGFEDRLRQLERLVDCIERLEALNSSGAVDRFSAALKR